MRCRRTQELDWGSESATSVHQSPTRAVETTPEPNRVFGFTSACFPPVQVRQHVIPHRSRRSAPEAPERHPQIPATSAVKRPAHGRNRRTEWFRQEHSRADGRDRVEVAPACAAVATHGAAEEVHHSREMQKECPLVLRHCAIASTCDLCVGSDPHGR
jgi:hypothetical protein